MALVIKHEKIYIASEKIYRVDQKKCPTLSESIGISLQIQDDSSTKWGIFLVHPVDFLRCYIYFLVFYDECHLIYSGCHILLMKSSCKLTRGNLAIALCLSSATAYLGHCISDFIQPYWPASRPKMK